MEKIYVIMETGFEYNDEIYHTPESGGGAVKKAFRSKKNAEEEVTSLFRDWIGNNYLHNFGYNDGEVLSEHGLDLLKGILSPEAGNLLVAADVHEENGEFLQNLSSHIREVIKTAPNKIVRDILWEMQSPPFYIQEIEIG